MTGDAGLLGCREGRGAHGHLDRHDTLALGQRVDDLQVDGPVGQAQLEQLARPVAHHVHREARGRARAHHAGAGADALELTDDALDGHGVLLPGPPGARRASDWMLPRPPCA